MGPSIALLASGMAGAAATYQYQTGGLACIMCLLSIGTGQSMQSPPKRLHSSIYPIHPFDCTICVYTYPIG